MKRNLSIATFFLTIILSISHWRLGSARVDTREGGSIVLYCLVIFTFAASRRCIITTHDLGGNFSIPKWSKANHGVGAQEICDIEEIKEKICLQKELRDLQNQRRCAIVPILTQVLQQVGESSGKFLIIFRVLGTTCVGFFDRFPNDWSNGMLQMCIRRPSAAW